MVDGHYLPYIYKNKCSKTKCFLIFYPNAKRFLFLYMEDCVLYRC